MRPIVKIRRAFRHVHLRRPKLPSLGVSLTAALAAVLIFSIALSILHSSVETVSQITLNPTMRRVPIQVPSIHANDPDHLSKNLLRSRVDAIVAGRHAHTALHAAYDIPIPIVNNMTQHDASRLYWKLVYTDVVRALQATHMPNPANDPLALRPSSRVFFIHTQNGLGNRLRALASGLAIARATGRVPVVIWERDAHLGATFPDLFETTAFGSDIQTVLYRDLVVLDSFPPWAEISAPNPSWHPVNYMEKDGIDGSQKLIRFHGLSLASNLNRTASVMRSFTFWSGPRSEAHIYFKSAYVALTEPKFLSSAEFVNREMTSLRPSKKVMAIFGVMDTGILSQAIGIHIRSRTLSNDNVSVNYHCEYTTSGAATTNFWRSQSQPPVFLEQMRLISKIDGNGVKFFVASDDVKILQTLEAEFPQRILSIPRNCDDRHESCVLYALADMLSLSKTKVIYGSNWSSFTEAAGRIGNLTIYRSGVDFGRRRHVRRFSRGVYGIWEEVTGVMRWGVAGVVRYLYYPSKGSEKFTNCIRW